jgi:hypothetical protein
MRGAQIDENGLVFNVIEVDEADLDAFQAIECSDEVGIGWIYDGKDWTAPPPPEEDPEVIT